MRPAGEVSQALLQAVQQLSTPDRGATLREIAEHAQVGLSRATQTIKDMRRYGRIAICGARKVPGRNRPAAEYALPVPVPVVSVAANDAVFGLSQAIQLWG